MYIILGEFNTNQQYSYTLYPIDMTSDRLMMLSASDYDKLAEIQDGVPICRGTHTLAVTNGVASVTPKQ